MAKPSGRAPYYNNLGRNMSNHHRFDPSAMTAAMLHVPLGMIVHVTNVLGGKSIDVTVTDHGPYVQGRIIDHTPTAFTALAGGLGPGVIEVEVMVP